MSTFSKLLFSLICLLASGLANAADEAPTIGGTSVSPVYAFSSMDVAALSVYTGSATTTLTCEYGTTTAYGSTQAYYTTLSAGNTRSSASVTLVNLTPGTLYHYRFKAQNAVNTAYTADATFTTPTPPTLATLAATNVADLSVKLNGTVTPYSDLLSYDFQWGTTVAYGNAVNTGSGASNNIREATVTSLLPCTTYHFRFKASSYPDAFYGEDMVFTTSAAATPPIINSTSSNSIQPTSVSLSASLNSGSSPTTLTFEYGPTLSYGWEAVYSTTLSTNSSSSGTVNQINLTPGTAYHYRAKALNGQGTAYSTDKTFTTLNPPVLITSAATAVTDLTATLNGTVNPGGDSFYSYFDWGLTSTYGNYSYSSYSSGTATVPVSLNISRLLPNTTYHFRIRNSASSYFGSDMTFTTAAPATPPIIAYSSSSSVTATSVRLAADVDSGSSPTTLSFEYGPTSAYGWESIYSTTLSTNSSSSGTVNLAN